MQASRQGRVFGLRSAVGRGLEPVGSVVAGVVIAHVAGPAMVDGGVAASTLGTALGVGAERGAAVVLLATGIALVALGAWLGRSWINRAIDDGGTPADRSRRATFA